MSDEHRDRLRFIRSGRDLGFSPDQIGDLLRYRVKIFLLVQRSARSQTITSGRSKRRLLTSNVSPLSSGESVPPAIGRVRWRNAESSRRSREDEKCCHP
ncbi:MAG: MerR family DNA-binding protein [Acidobacteria bacterium]|nr:MerR family DNA-binding protein [Acidobacteriota bacterium]